MSRANRILVGALMAIVVLAVAAALIARTRSAPPPAAGSPEASVQAYLNATLAGRNDEAARQLDPGGECDVRDLDRFTDMGMPAARVLLVDSAVEGSTATVRVNLVYASGGPFDPSEGSTRRTYRLVRSDGRWLLTGVPWPLVECRKE